MGIFSRSGFPAVLALIFLVSHSLAAQPADVSSTNVMPAPTAPLETWEPLSIPEPATGTGYLQLTVETRQEKTPRMYSRRAEHVEIWWRDRRLAALHKGDPDVLEAYHARIFAFPRIELPVGYHFIQVRLYGVGWISKNRKWKGQILQIGIQPGKGVFLHRRIPFHIW